MTKQVFISEELAGELEEWGKLTASLFSRFRRELRDEREVISRSVDPEAVNEAFVYIDRMRKHASKFDPKEVEQAIAEAIEETKHAASA